MRMTTEPGDYVSMATRLRRRVLQNLAQFRWRTSRKLLGKCDGALQVGELLGMPQGRKKKVFSQGVSRAA